MGMNDPNKRKDLYVETRYIPPIYSGLSQVSVAVSVGFEPTLHQFLYDVYSASIRTHQNFSVLSYAELHIVC